jgi:hypothetical protein
VKVQSFQVFEMLDECEYEAGSRLVPMFARRSRAREPLVIDGPFAETKESCSYVALLAQRIRSSAKD